VLLSNSIDAKIVSKISDGGKELLGLIKSGDINLVINTPSGAKGQTDASPIRSAAVLLGVPCITTLHGAQAAVTGMEAFRKSNFGVTPIQDYLKIVK